MLELPRSQEPGVISGVGGEADAGSSNPEIKPEPRSTKRDEQTDKKSESEKEEIERKKLPEKKSNMGEGGGALHLVGSRQE